MMATRPEHSEPDHRDSAARPGPALRLIATTDALALATWARADCDEERARRQAQAVSDYFATDPDAISWMLRVLA